MKTKKIEEGKILIIGFILIILVIFLTLFRSTKEKEVDNNEYLSETNQTNYSLLYPKEVQRKLIQEKENTILLDIRSTYEYNNIHIVDSINIPLEDLKNNLNSLPREKNIIVIWRTADSTTESKAINILKNNNFSNVFILSGGIESWKRDINNKIVSEGDPSSFTDNSKVEYINTEDFNKLKKAYSLFILDVRNSSEFENGHLKGASNIPLDQLEQNRDKITSLMEIIVYGKDDLQSFKAGTKLFDLGFLNVRILKEGFSELKTAGFEIE